MMKAARNFHVSRGQSRSQMASPAHSARVAKRPEIAMSSNYERIS